MKSREKLNSRIDGRLATYATLAGAALAAPAVPTADATVIWSGPVSINIPSTTAGIYLNVATGVFNASPASVPGWDVNLWSSSSLNTFTSTGTGGNGVGLPGGAYVGTGSNYFNLAFGTVISGASTYGGTGTNTIAAATPLNLNSSNNLIGFRFVNQSMANQIQFGWVRVSLSSTPQAQPRAIVEYAYEDSGGSIMAGQVPEPSTVALLGVMAAGALGVRAWRRRKAA